MYHRYLSDTVSYHIKNGKKELYEGRLGSASSPPPPPPPPPALQRNKTKKPQINNYMPPPESIIPTTSLSASGTNVSRISFPGCSGTSCSLKSKRLLKPGHHTSSVRGLKPDGFKLWVKRVRPHRARRPPRRPCAPSPPSCTPRRSGHKVDPFEKQTLKPVFSLCRLKG